MASLKITERPIAPSITGGASILVSQPETVNGQQQEVLRRISANEFAGPAIIPTVTAPLVTISDGADRPAASVITHIEPVQEGSGDPSPDNVRPISGWDSVKAWRTGKNLIPNQFVKGRTLGISGGKIVEYSLANVYLVRDILLPPGTYVLSGPATAYIYVYDKNLIADEKLTNVHGVATPCTITLSQYAYFGVSGDEEASKVYQLEYASVATAYEPYQGQTLTAALPETVYGGKLDWTTGVLIKDVVLDGATMSTNGYQDEYDDAEHAVFAFSLPRCEQNEKPNIICSHFPYASHPQHHGGKECCGFNPSEIYSDYFYIIIKKSRLSSVSPEGMNAWLRSQSDFKLVYVPEQPESIQLTPQQINTLKGVNNAWSSDGKTELAYIADTKLYIDQRIAALLNL